MMTRQILAALAALFFAVGFAVAAERVQLVAAFDMPVQVDNLGGAGIDVREVYSGDARTFVVFEASNEAALHSHLEEAGLEPARLLPVDFINSPAVGGGTPAGETPKSGHRVYVIERPIPGVGSFPLEKKQMISKRSNQSVAELGGAVEWDHSFLTDEGTFCVYRGVDEAAIRRHAELAGAPIETITEVTIGEPAASN